MSLRRSLASNGRTDAPASHGGRSGSSGVKSTALSSKLATPSNSTGGHALAPANPGPSPDPGPLPAFSTFRALATVDRNLIVLHARAENDFIHVSHLESVLQQIQIPHSVPSAPSEHQEASASSEHHEADGDASFHSASSSSNTEVLSKDVGIPFRTSVQQTALLGLLSASKQRATQSRLRFETAVRLATLKLRSRNKPQFDTVTSEATLSAFFNQVRRDEREAHRTSDLVENEEVRSQDSAPHSKSRQGYKLDNFVIVGF